MTAVLCIQLFAVFIIPLNVVEILALDLKNGCPTYEEVGAIEIDLEKYKGTWYDFIHSSLYYSCSLEVHSGIRNSSGYYFKLDYAARFPNGSVLEEHDVAFPSSTTAKGYSGYDEGYKYMNAFLDTVYDKYSIEFACEETSAGTEVLLYAITRSVEVDKLVLQKLEEFNQKLGLCVKIRRFPNQCKGLKLC